MSRHPACEANVRKSGLVVIDAGSLEAPRKGGDRNYGAADLARTLRILADADKDGRLTYRARIVRDLAWQIEEQTRPPKPPEPQGLGAVVEDAEGVRWVRNDYKTQPWMTNGQGVHAWPDIDAVKVLSEGVRDE